MFLFIIVGLRGKAPYHSHLGNKNLITGFMDMDELCLGINDTNKFIASRDKLV